MVTVDSYGFDLRAAVEPTASDFNLAQDSFFVPAVECHLRHFQHGGDFVRGQHLFREVGSLQLEASDTCCLIDELVGELAQVAGIDLQDGVRHT